MVQLSVVDANGKPVKVAYIETINTRTGRKRTNLQNGPNYTHQQEIMLMFW